MDLLPCKPLTLALVAIYVANLCSCIIMYRLKVLQDLIKIFHVQLIQMEPTVSLHIMILLVMVVWIY